MIRSLTTGRSAGRAAGVHGSLVLALSVGAAAAMLLNNVPLAAQDGRNAKAFIEDEPQQGKYQPLPITPKRIPTLHVNLDPIQPQDDSNVNQSGGIAGACPPSTVSHATFNWSCTGSCPILLQAGLVETEIAAASFSVPADQFPIKLDMAEMIFGTSQASVQTTTHWSLLVWDGPPNTGILVAEYSSDGEILPHIVLPPGSTGINVQVSVDPGDPEQIFIFNNSGTNMFSIGYRVDQHNNPPTSPCSCPLIGQLPAVCCPPPTNSNAFPAADTNGLQQGSKNWVWVRNCPGASQFCGVASQGWYTSSQLGISGDWIIRATYSPTTCVTTGACCLLNGTCLSDVTASQCAAQGGVYQGDGTNCSSINCPVPTGACCVAGDCVPNQTAAECQAQGGTFMGVGVGCTTNTCRGACCVPSTQQCVFTTVSNCAAAGGSFAGYGTNCTTTPCFGACCMPDGSCIGGLSPAQCLTQGGTFQGGNTNCAEVNCPAPVGACCLGTNCLADVTEEECVTGFGGVWQGMSSVCDPVNPCDPLGACCLGSTCLSDVTEGECTAGFGGVWQGANATCTPSNPCSQPTCPADIAPQPAGNGAVDVSDLLMVISSWGPCGVGDCPADIAPLPGGDDVVNVADLLMVINHWGPCE